MSCKSDATTWKIMGVYSYSKKSHKPFESNEKLKVWKKATS